MKNFFKKQYVVENNIIKFHIDDKTVKENIDFYTEAPFPDYGDNEDKFSINYKGQKNYLTREFKKFVGFNQNILEVGCGTGQLSIYLSIGTNNRIFALDPALTSINLGKIFSIKNKIQNVKFVNADIFDDVFQEKTFDFIAESIEYLIIGCPKKLIKFLFFILFDPALAGIIHKIFI